MQSNRAKALELHKKLWELRGEDEHMKEFVASDGWLWRFCRRHGIRQLSLQGEKLLADKPAAEGFITTFEEYIEGNHYTLKSSTIYDNRIVLQTRATEDTCISFWEVCYW